MKHSAAMRITAALMAFLMALCTVWYFPGEYLPGLDLFAVGASASSSGKCGDDLVWNLSEDGVLTISGTGNMYDYSYIDEDDFFHSGEQSNVSPWYSLRSDIRSLVIEKGAA